MKFRAKTSSEVVTVVLLFYISVVNVQSANGADKRSIGIFLNNNSNVETCTGKGANYPSILYRCNDGTVSYEQQDSEFLSGGICGQVAVANVLANLCKNFGMTPNFFDYQIRPEAGDGTNAAQLLEHLNRIDEGKACQQYLGRNYFYYELGSVKNYGIPWVNGTTPTLAWALERFDKQPEGIKNPVVVALSMPGAAGHWTTVVRVEEKQGRCTVVHNTWRKQYRTSCYRFAQIAREMLHLRKRN